MDKEQAAKAMDEMADWALQNVSRPIRAMAPDAEIAARYGALQQSLAHYREAGNVRLPLSRADEIIIAAKDGDRSEIGTLRGEVRRLCDEIDAMSNPITSTSAEKCGETWRYIDVRASEDFGYALVRCFYDADIDADAGPELRAVYLAGFDITQALTSPVIDDLVAMMKAELEVAAEASAIDSALDRIAK